MHDCLPSLIHKGRRYIDKAVRVFKFKVHLILTAPVDWNRKLNALNISLLLKFSVQTANNFKLLIYFKGYENVCMVTYCSTKLKKTDLDVEIIK